MITGNGIIAQATRYVAVGLVVLAVDFAVYWAILLTAPERFLAANLAGKAVGAALGFLLHRTVTFRWEQRDPPARQLLSYLAILAFNLMLSSLLLWLAIDRFGANAYFAKLAVDIVIVGSAFLLSRLWVYRRL